MACLRGALGLAVIASESSPICRISSSLCRPFSNFLSFCVFRRLAKFLLCLKKLQHPLSLSPRLSPLPSPPWHLSVTSALGSGHPTIPPVCIFNTRMVGLPLGERSQGSWQPPCPFLPHMEKRTCSVVRRACCLWRR